MLPLVVCCPTAHIYGAVPVPGKVIKSVLSGKVKIDLHQLVDLRQQAKSQIVAKKVA